VKAALVSLMNSGVGVAGISISVGGTGLGSAVDVMVGNDCGVIIDKSAGVDIGGDDGLQDVEINNAITTLSNANFLWGFFTVLSPVSNQNTRNGHR
jgi:hypothetical protein